MYGPAVGPLAVVSALSAVSLKVAAAAVVISARSTSGLDGASVAVREIPVRVTTTAPLTLATWGSVTAAVVLRPPAVAITGLLALTPR